MQLTNGQLVQLERFFSNSRFTTEGAVITDLDGTAVHEFQGKTVIHHSVEMGLKKMHDQGRPVVINTLRFPLSVIRTFGKEWYRISNASIPAILLNGSQLGFISKNDDSFSFEQLASFVLLPEDIAKTMESVKRLLDSGIYDFVLFYYPEDWKAGEIIWTPLAINIPYLQEKYRSASSVVSTGFNELNDMLLAKPVCMILLLIEVPSDRLMAYQHTQRNNFITRTGVDKLYGAGQMGGLLGFDLAHSIGAGDSMMDNFLEGIGLSVHVGNSNLPFKGRMATMKLPGFFEFGDLLYRFAEMQQQVLMK